MKRWYRQIDTAGNEADQRQTRGYFIECQDMEAFTILASILAARQLKAEYYQDSRFENHQVYRISREELLQYLYKHQVNIQIYKKCKKGIIYRVDNQIAKLQPQLHPA